MYKYRKSLVFGRAGYSKRIKWYFYALQYLATNTKTPIMNPLEGILVLTGGCFTLAGYITKRFPPKKINHLYGYRTRTSMQHQEAWDFAQKYSANEMMKLGTIMLVLAGAIWLADIQFKGDIVVAIALTVVFPLFMFFQVEQELKKRFPKIINACRSSKTIWCR